jgi:hypothetical protein
MIIPILMQVYDEVRRLAIAGSVVAPGDFRLKKLAPALEQAGKKAPVFAKVAEAVKGIVESNEQTSAQALLELSTLVNAILYTQGETGLAGELTPIETIDLGQRQTHVSAQVLKPLLDALTTAGSGRMEVIEEAFENGAFCDWRLVGPATDTIDDPNLDVAEFVAENILPLYGKAIYGELRAKFDPKGRSGQARRLTIMHQLDPTSTREILEDALGNGTIEIRVAAIECLTDSPEDLSLLLEQAKSKAKDVRAAALKVLSGFNADSATTAVCEALERGDIESAVDAARKSTDPRVKSLLLRLARVLMEELLTSDATEKRSLDRQANRFRALLTCFVDTEDHAAEAFLLDAFNKRDRLAAVKANPGGMELQHRLMHVMSSGSLRVRQALVDAIPQLDHAEFLETAFDTALHSLPPADAFDLLSPYLKVDLKKKSKHYPAAMLKRDALAELLIRNPPQAIGDGTSLDDQGNPIFTLDPRWIDMAIERQHVELAASLAFPGHAALDQFLLHSFAQKDANRGMLLAAMVRAKHPAATDCAIALIQQLAAESRPRLGWLTHSIAKLSKAAAGELEALIPTLPEKLGDDVLQCVIELKQRT